MNVRSLLPALALAATTRVSAQSAPALPRSTPEHEGIPSAAVLAFVQAADTAVDAMNSFMLVRHGRIVAEGWWGPYEARTPHILYSLSKSFTSTAVGLAAAEGKLSVDDPVLKFFPDEAPAQPSANLRAMRVRDLLRMVTGHQTEAALFGPVDSSMRTASWVKRFFAHPVAFKPGTHFLYNSPATYMLSAIVQKTTGQTVLDYLTPRLFVPLGIEKPTWVTSPEGIDAGAYGLSVRTEDIAKLGQLYLQKGAWNGQQLVPAAWVAEATARQTSNGSAPTSDWDQGYGYQFWQSRHGYRGDGAFGQYMLVLPQYDAVVAITSGTRDMQSVMNLVWDKLLPAMQPQALAEDAAARAQLQAKLAKLTVRLVAGRPSTPLASKVSGRWYDMPDNDRGIRAVMLELGARAPAVVVRTAAGDLRTPFAFGAWARSTGGWTNGIDRQLSVSSRPALAASGGWTADSVLTVKIAAPETPFYSTMTFRFDGDRLLLDGEHNVSFGPPRLPQLVGTAARRAAAK
ncbi:MAG: beta-lactamase [Gemmatimonadetes bacterium]|nr:beta-lactamase [Gemmatimonadota bacterium]